MKEIRVVWTIRAVNENLRRLVNENSRRFGKRNSRRFDHPRPI